MHKGQPKNVLTAEMGSWVMARCWSKGVVGFLKTKTRQTERNKILMRLVSEVNKQQERGSLRIISQKMQRSQ